MKTVFLRVLDANDKATALLEAVREPGRARGRQRFEVDAASFAAVPRSPFAYWVSERLLRLFKELPAFESNGRKARMGLATANDFRFVRMWWEVPWMNRRPRWFPMAKGGAFSPFYADLALVVNWTIDDPPGHELKAFAETTPGTTHWSRNLRNTDFYFRAGLTWPLRTHRFCPQVLPAGAVISVRGSGIFADRPDVVLGLFSGQLIDYVMRMLSGKDAHPQYDGGDIAQLPIPWLSDSDENALATLSRRAWSLKRSLDIRTEASHAFTLPALMHAAGADLAARAADWSEHVCTVEAELGVIQAELDDRCFVLYGIDEADRRTITEGVGGRGSEEASSDGANDAEDGAGEDIDENESTADATVLAAELVSWAVGVAFGRFDVRLATGARPMPTEPEPFDPLPACSPGMLTGGDGLPLARPPAGYPLTFPEAGVLVGDLGHGQDLPTAVRAVFDAVFGAGADRWWNDVAALLDPKGHDLRVWLAGSFFEHHLKRHSKSRRRAPIVWQLGTLSGRYSVWLYAHRLKRDSFFQLQNEVVGPKLTHEERQLTSLMREAGGNPSAPERKEIGAQEAVVEELRAMLDEFKRVAPLWNPNLDDGVVLSMAPLWRLVPQHKSWQKELKCKWDELCDGAYDWAHIAIHLWPERVVPKCATDRSLAIAHGLEEVFWQEDATGKWGPRKVDQATIAKLVAERVSAAVKDALKSLLEAPGQASGGKARGRKQRRDNRSARAKEL